MLSTRLKKQIHLLASGGFLCTIATTVGLIDFGSIFVSLIATFLQIVISTLFGADVSSQILAGLLG
jgi:hypothetical protein